MYTIRDELISFNNNWGRLPGSKLSQMITFPYIYSLDSLSAAVHSKVCSLRDSREFLSEMEIAFLGIFEARYNY